MRVSDDSVNATGNEAAANTYAPEKLSKHNICFFYHNDFKATGNEQLQLSDTADAFIHVRGVNEHSSRFVAPIHSDIVHIDIPCDQVTGRLLYTFIMRAVSQ